MKCRFTDVHGEQFLYYRYDFTTSQCFLYFKLVQAKNIVLNNYDKMAKPPHGVGFIGVDKATSTCAFAKA